MMTDREILDWGANVTDTELALFFLVANAHQELIGMVAPLDERAFVIRNDAAALRGIRSAIERQRELMAELCDPQLVLQAACAEARLGLRHRMN